VILVDSSSWIHFLRPNGDPAVRARVESALTAGEACWCPLVRLELWNGAAGERDRKILRDFESVLPELSIDDEVWAAADALARRARSSGVSVPADGHPDRGVCTTARCRARDDGRGFRVVAVGLSFLRLCPHHCSAGRCPIARDGFTADRRPLRAHVRLCECEL